MPIYEYTCANCDARFDKLVRSMCASGNESEKVPCPKCGKTNTSRTFSVFAVGAAEASGSKSRSLTPTPGMCGRCGGPGPCASGG